MSPSSSPPSPARHPPRRPHPPPPSLPTSQPSCSFDGTDLSHFDTFLRDRGLNNDPDHVFTVDHGLLHVSGHEMGYVITKQSFRRFYLRAEFKWGEGTFGERAGQARDSGILYSIQGENKVWPRSVEFQIKEGETGDLWMTDGAAVTGSDGKRVTGPPNSALNIGHIDKGPPRTPSASATPPASSSTRTASGIPSSSSSTATSSITTSTANSPSSAKTPSQPKARSSSSPKAPRSSSAISRSPR